MQAREKWKEKKREMNKWPRLSPFPLDRAPSYLVCQCDLLGKGVSSCMYSFFFGVVYLSLQGLWHWLLQLTPTWGRFLSSQCSTSVLLSFGIEATAKPHITLHERNNVCSTSVLKTNPTVCLNPSSSLILYVDTFLFFRARSTDTPRLLHYEKK